MRKALQDYITTIPDFPKKGILFRDITSLLQDGEGFHAAIDAILEKLDDVEFDAVVGLEARGFLIGAPVAYAAKKGFVPVRKKGKLPRETVSAQYALEYGTAEVEIHRDSLKQGDRVVIIDDLLCNRRYTGSGCEVGRTAGRCNRESDFSYRIDGLKGQGKAEEV